MKKLLATSILAILALSLNAAEIKLLTIGNSFADSAFVYLPKVTESAGDKITMVKANIGGCSLEKHWTLAQTSEKDPSLKTHGYGKTKDNLQNMLKQDTWDYVTIQQASPLSWKKESYQPYANNLQQLVKKLAPQAELVMQQTWAYRIDQSRLKKWKLTQEEMYNKLTKAYTEISNEMGIRMIPTGHAIQLARKKQTGTFVPFGPEVTKDIKHPKRFPQEKNCFCTGYHWRKITDKKTKEVTYKPNVDASHLNQRGQYLQACVWYGFFFKKPVSNVTFVPKGITPEDAAFLKQIAQETLDTYCK